MNRIQSRSRERGALSPFILIFLVTLAIMSTATYYMVAGESQNLGGSVASIKAEYAALSGVYFAISALNANTFTSAVESTTYSISGVEVSLDTVKISGQPSFFLRVVAEKDGAQRRIQFRIDYPFRLSEKAITTTGTTNMATLDSLGGAAPERSKTSADSIPTINTTSLNLLSTSQGHNKTTATWNPFTATGGTYLGTFWNSPGVPNVTHVTGNLTSNGNDNLWGIFIVDGNVSLKGTTRIYGVIYMPNSSSTFQLKNASSGSVINGSIIARSNLTSNNSNDTAKHIPTYAKAFANYQVYPDNYKKTVHAPDLTSPTMIYY